ncbi:MAG: Uncharacterised protein [Methanobacteriota archaeon]|nr:MAG: Uncharacterised protein [Euryarchaeota archaeon]
MITTLSQRSVDSQSSAILNAAVAEAQATFIVELGPLIPTCWANCECPIVKIWNRYLRSKRPSSSAPLFLACFAAIWCPEKHEEKTTPVLSRYIEGISQERINLSPPLPICSTGVRGIAASLSANNPAAHANCVDISHDCRTLESIPNSSAASKAPFSPAN